MKGKTVILSEAKNLPPVCGRCFVASLLSMTIAGCAGPQVTALDVEIARARAEAELAASSPDARTADIEIWPDPAIQKGMVVQVLESGESPRVALVRAVKMEEARSEVNAALTRRMTLTVEYRI